MISYPNRSEERETELYHTSEQGELSNRFILYPSEMTKLEIQGFKIYDVKPFCRSKNLYFATVDWSQAFGLAIPHIVYSYTNRFIETFPKDSINNFAQELYVIAKRVQKN